MTDNMNGLLIGTKLADNVKGLFTDRILIFDRQNIDR